MTTKFKSRYVLGEGYIGIIEFCEHNGVAIFEKDDDGSVHIILPKELSEEDCPPYRLVLERVE